MASHRLSEPADIAQFITGGKALFTLVNEESGERVTYKVRHKENGNGKGSVSFVSYLNGPDNWYNYQYLGLIRDGCLSRRPSRPSAKARRSRGLTICIGWW